MGTHSFECEAQSGATHAIDSEFIVEVIDPAPCGRTFTRFAGDIIARADDMVVVVRGVNLYPAAVENLLRQHQPIEEFRVTINPGSEMAEIIIEIECRDGGDDSDVAREVSAQFGSVVGLRPTVNQVERGALPSDREAR